MKIKNIYDDCKIYGPYINYEGRAFLFIVYPNGKRESTLVSRYKVERKLNRKLSKNEHVHHKDKNFKNDKLNNLEVIDGIIHRKNHAIYREGKYLFCHTCGLIFWATGKMLHGRNRGKTGFDFCSRKCIGIFTRKEQIKKGQINLRGLV